ncbi:MAG: hypothetical protein KGH75_01680 [Rhodospirillales bacterium]|nr:hypothetical protein [Rhodospirillales bacterium]
MNVIRFAFRVTGAIVFAMGIYLLLCAPGFLSDASSTVPINTEDSP